MGIGRKNDETPAAFSVNQDGISASTRYGRTLDESRGVFRIEIERPMIAVRDATAVCPLVICPVISLIETWERRNRREKFLEQRFLNDWFIENLLTRSSIIL